MTDAPAQSKGIIGHVVQKDIPVNPTQLQHPAFLLNFPFSYSTRTANNAWMKDLDDEQRRPDLKRAIVQFLELYRFMASESVVYLLPTPRGSELQDLVFTGNLGIVLEHSEDQNSVVVSNFTSEPRRGETPVGVNFFEGMGYDVFVSPHRFEGEAELKHLHDNVYVGGYGIRSERETYDWMERQFDMKVVKVRETDDYLYHLDCTVFPLTREETLVCTEMYEQEELAELERYTDIIDVSVDDCYQGICNSARVSNLILNSSRIHELKRGTEEYALELHKNRTLEDIATEAAFEVNYFNLSEYEKGGALLSCMVLHLNRYSYAFKLM
jgi:N-dimethylarginine dimethylaminohydrolase